MRHLGHDLLRLEMQCSDGGWPVDGCYAGSPAEEAGILAGDSITEIGNNLPLALKNAYLCKACPG